MKRIYIAIFFLTLSIGLCVFEQYTVESTYKNTTVMLNTAQELLHKKDYDGIVKECSRLNEYWDKKYPCLSAMFDHDSLDEAGASIASLEELAKSKSDDFESELINAKSRIEAIHKNQKITFGNIF